MRSIAAGGVWRRGLQSDLRLFARREERGFPEVSLRALGVRGVSGVEARRDATEWRGLGGEGYEAICPLRAC